MINGGNFGIKERKKKIIRQIVALDRLKRISMKADGWNISLKLKQSNCISDTITFDLCKIIEIICWNIYKENN